MFTDLYNTDILTLASTLENKSLPSPNGTARKVSKLCGSWVEVDLLLKGESSEYTMKNGKTVRVKDYYVWDWAMRLEACALGQASAAILNEGMVAASYEDLVEGRDALRAILKTGAKAPKGRFAKLALLSGVAKYPARHASTLLPFEAAVAAFEDYGCFGPHE